MKLNSAVSKFLTNKWVLNIVALLSLFNVIGYAVMGNINAVLHFIVFAVLIRYFSKNMTIVLGVPLIIVNLLAMKSNMLEGMENNKEKQVKQQDQNTSKQTQNEPKEPMTIQESSNTQLKNGNKSSDNAAQKTGGEQQGFEAGRRKNRGNNIDYATTVEDAYDELNNILGSDGIQRLTSDTQNLMKQQMQLAKAMESMGPMMQSLAPMVENLKGMMGDSNVNEMMSMAKKFTSS
jgi:hypothetical protein